MVLQTVLVVKIFSLLVPCTLLNNAFFTNIHANEPPTGALTGAAFTPAGDKLITTAIDQTVMVWHDLSNKNKNTKLEFAHIGGVDRLSVLSDTMFVTTGSDRTVRTWEIKA
jgi:WD40 repeat protein